MSEYFTNLGRREELRQERVKASIMAEEMRDSLREELNPACKAARLNEEKIMILAASLAEKIGELREIEAGLDAIKKVIGK